MVNICVGIALEYGVIFSASLNLVPEQKGSASSLIMFLRLILVSIGVWLAGKYYTGVLIDTAKIIALFTTIGILACMFVITEQKSIQEEVTEN